MNLKKKKKNDVIYNQGDFATSVYFLSKGEVKLTKEAKLFQENPNSLYMDRIDLLDDLYKTDDMDRLEKIDT